MNGRYGNEIGQNETGEKHSREKKNIRRRRKTFEEGENVIRREEKKSFADSKRTKSDKLGRMTTIKDYMQFPFSFHSQFVSKCRQISVSIRVALFSCALRQLGSLTFNK